MGRDYQGLKPPTLNTKPQVWGAREETTIHAAISEKVSLGRNKGACHRASLSLKGETGERSAGWKLPLRGEKGHEHKGKSPREKHGGRERGRERATEGERLQSKQKGKGTK